MAYDMWLSVEETTWMLFFPTLSLLGKLRRLMIENLNQHAEKMLMDITIPRYGHIYNKGAGGFRPPDPPEI